MIGLIVSNSRRLGEPDLALLLLVGAGLILVSAVQLTFFASQYYVSAAEYRSVVELAQQEGVGEERFKPWHVHSLDRYRRWARRAERTYDVGVVVLLAGVGVTLIPPRGVWEMPALRLAPLVVIAMGALAQAVSAFVLPALYRRRVTSITRAR